MREEAREKKRKENIAESLKRNCDQLTRSFAKNKKPKKQQNIRKIRANFREEIQGQEFLQPLFRNSCESRLIAEVQRFLNNPRTQFEGGNADHHMTDYINNSTENQRVARKKFTAPDKI